MKPAPCFLFLFSLSTRIILFFINKFFLNYWLLIPKTINFKNQLPRLVQELEYETNIKRLGYLSLLYTETIISVLIFIILQQLIEVGAFASISTVLLAKFFSPLCPKGDRQKTKSLTPPPNATCLLCKEIDTKVVQCNTNTK